MSIEEMINRIRERASKDSELARQSTENLSTLNVTLIHEHGTSVTNEIVKAIQTKTIKDIHGQGEQSPTGNDQQ